MDIIETFILSKDFIEGTKAEELYKKFALSALSCEGKAPTSQYIFTRSLGTYRLAL